MRKKLKDLHNKLDEVIKIYGTFPTSIRPHNVNGCGGGLIEFKHKNKKDPSIEYIIVGDLHTNIKNLKAILEENDNKNKLENGQAVLIFLGDIVHDDRVGYLIDMEPSLIILEYVFELIIKYTHNIIYLKGNHETFSEQLSKSGIRQGPLFKEHIIKKRGKEYFRKIAYFFKLLPVFVLSDHFMATHAGPIRKGADRETLINIDNHKSEKMQLIWNRINQTWSTPSTREYDVKDINAMRRKLNRDENCYFIVSHDPLHERKSGKSIWFDVMDTKNYIIIYDALSDLAPFISFQNASQYKLYYADLKIKKGRFALDNY